MDDILKIEHLPEALKRNAIWLLVLGSILIVGGVCALLSPLFVSLFVVYVIGFVFLLAGVAQVIQAFMASGWKGSALHILAGVLYILGGLLIMFESLTGLIAVSLVVVATFIAGGIVRLIAAFQLRPEDGWGWIALGGAASIIGGLIIWASFPESAAVLLGVIAGITFIAEGWGMIQLGMAARKLSNAMT